MSINRFQNSFLMLLNVATTLSRKSKKKIIAGRTLNDIILNINEQKEY